MPLDTETTGVDAARDRVVEIGLIPLDENLEPVREYEARVNPGVSIPEAASKIHGIRDEDVADCPSFSRIAGRVMAIIGDRPIIAQNAPFDIGMLSKGFERAQVTASY